MDSVPYSLSIIVCERVVVDQASGSKYIMGTFSDIYATSFPWYAGPVEVMATLTDGRGVQDVVLELPLQR